MEDGGWPRRLACIAICILVPLVCFASAARASCPPWRGPSVVIGPAGERVCAKHHERLQKTTVYGPDPAICILVQQTRKAAAARACSPNALPFGITRAQSRFYSRAAESFYCSQCEAFLQAQLRK
jgi:hypothetical protein